MRASFEKPYLFLKDKPILAHTLLALERSPQVREIILLVRRSRIALASKLVRAFRLKKVIGVYAGGASRFESVWKGIQKISSRSDFVLVHDGARPLVSQALIRRVVRGASRYGAAIPALPVNSTVKEGKGRFVARTLIRKNLWEIQTPQVFRKSLLLAGYRKAKKEKVTATDCAALVERLGQKVYLVPGEPRNVKITTKEELALAELWLRGKESAPCAWG